MKHGFGERKKKTAEDARGPQLSDSLAERDGDLRDFNY